MTVAVGVQAPPPASVAAVGSWVHLTLVLGARMYRAFLLGLVAVAVAPLLLGWSSYVIESGSMRPSIEVGDVVVAKPYADGERIRVGRVFVFDDPATAEPRTLTHRVVELRDDGTYTTAGDANDVTDITPLHSSDVRGTAVLLTPYVGLPLTWAQTGQWTVLALWLLVTIAAFVLAERRLRDEPPRWGKTRWLLRLTRVPRRRRLPHPDVVRTDRLALRCAAPATGALLLAVLVTGASTSNAGFTARTVTGAMSWTVGAIMQPYTAAVITDQPALFWLLDETSGTQGADRSGNNRGALMTGIQTGVPGALPRNPGTAVRLDNGTDRIVSGGAAQSAPMSFTVEMWFRKDGGNGGKMMGFESSQGPLSATHDRTVYMRNNGRIVYGAWSVLGSDYIESPGSYADGSWHHLAVAVTSTTTASSARMYVDGALVASGPTTRPTSYVGWWRVGYGTMAIGFNFPSAPWAADVDNVAVYNTALTAQRVAAHYAAR